tara:strand:+ start:26002 stop:26586 length:585 start_codon:yes stop_codon:yes gene_type:complete
MPKKAKKYKNKNKKYTEEELYEYLADYLLGYSTQEIAAGPGKIDSKQYLRQQKSVKNKLSETMKDILNTNLSMSTHRLGELYCYMGVNIVTSLLPVKKINTQIYIDLKDMSIDSMTSSFKLVIDSCIVDLVKDPANSTFDRESNRFTKIIDKLTDELKSNNLLNIIEAVIEDPDLKEKYKGIAIITKKDEDESR